MENLKNFVVRGYNKELWQNLATKTVLDGNLTLLDFEITAHKNCKVPPLALKKLNGNLIVINCTLSNQLASLLQVNGGVVMMNCKIADMKKLKDVQKGFELKNTNIVDASNLTHIGGNFVLNNSTIQKSNVRFVDGEKKVVSRAFSEDMKYFEQ